MRQLAADELACPPSAIKVHQRDRHLFTATGCGTTIDVACYDPHESTGAAKGAFDGATSGHRVHCERILDAPRTVANASATTFDMQAAARGLHGAATAASGCPGASDGSLQGGFVRVRFAPNGLVKGVELTPAADERVERCITAEFTKVRVPPFGGSADVTVKKMLFPTAAETSL